MFFPIARYLESRTFYVKLGAVLSKEFVQERGGATMARVKFRIVLC